MINALLSALCMQRKRGTRATNAIYPEMLPGEANESSIAENTESNTNIIFCLSMWQIIKTFLLKGNRNVLFGSQCLSITTFSTKLLTH